MITIQVDGEDIDVTECANANCSSLFPPTLSLFPSPSKAKREQHRDKMKLYSNCIQSKCSPTNKNTGTTTGDNTKTEKIPTNGLTDKTKTGMSRNTKIGLAIGGTLVLGVIILLVVRSRRKK